MIALWWVLSSRILLPRMDYTLGQLDVAILWAMMPALGILGGVTGGIEAAAWKNQQRNLSKKQAC